MEANNAPYRLLSGSFFIPCQCSNKQSPGYSLRRLPRSDPQTTGIRADTYWEHLLLKILSGWRGIRHRTEGRDMARSRSSSSAVRCVHCGKTLPLREGRPRRTCPTCGASQQLDVEDPLLRRSRAPAHEFHGANLIGTIVGGILGLPLGAFFGALVNLEKEPAMIVLLALVYAVGFAFLGCAFGFMAVGFWSRAQ